MARIRPRAATPPSAERFDAFLVQTEPRLRVALVATYGVTVGRDAAVDALAWAWSNWSRVQSMQNPVGYLYRVGQTSARRQYAESRRQNELAIRVLNHSERVIDSDARFEAADILKPALDSLSEQQRSAIVLVHGYGMPLRDAAETMNISVATVREHVKRAMTKLRTTMEVISDAV